MAMNSDQLEEILDGIERVHRSGGCDAVGALAMIGGLASLRDESSNHGSFDFNQLFPLSQIRVPLQNLDDALPHGWSWEQLDPTLQQLKAGLERGAQSELDLPDGLSLEGLLRAWYELRLFVDSGAVLRQNIQHNKETARQWILNRGLSEVLVVLDEDYRVIDGLAFCWALSEMDGHETIPAVILRDAPVDAGWQVTHRHAEAWGAKLWKKGEVQSLLESSTPREREFFRQFGFHEAPKTVLLTCSQATLDRLGPLAQKQYGGNTKFDPAQLLFIEALRERILEVRQEMIARGETGDIVKKLEKHLKDEAEAQRAGAEKEAAAAKRGKVAEWHTDAEGYWIHASLPRYRFEIVEPIIQVQAKQSPEQAEDPFLMSLSQFQVFARDHFGLASEDSSSLYGSESAASFNQKLRHYVDQNPVVPRRGPGDPGDDARRNQMERLALWNCSEQH
ncbi:hypothetical protein G7067_05210 [Leucobacter insecticola]|uniref:Uncharacterized protein n=1 Tax=Leucobacter insecticola TaxID=2714934 RepID=A0A6G8FIS0_9MICO|nr:hypothetical protein [Leucobacter insecticola]QIM15952.1 hypothetical protein G7067_05210 [Leucobacter insecticola]